MKAMVFAAGLGTRLRPLTDSCPKALVKVAGRHMLERVIGRLAGAGVNRIVVNVYHHASMIKDFLAGVDIDGVDIEVSDESDCLLDTGGGILKARRYLDGDEPIIIHNADILTDFDLREMVESHLGGGATATLLAMRRQSSRYLLFDAETGRLEGWENVKTGEVRPAGLDVARFEAMAFGGVQVLSPSVFDYLERYDAGPKFSIIPFFVDNCKEMEIKGFMPSRDYLWHDIGSLEKLKAAEADML